MAWREWNVAGNDQFGWLAKSAGVRRNPQPHAGTGVIRQEKTPTENGWGFDIGGGGGNRTRVRKPSTDSSTYLAVLFKFNRTPTNEQASVKRVTLDLTLNQVTRPSASLSI